MSSLLSAELAATCNALGYFDTKSNKYYADSNTLETVKDLIRYLKRDDDTHDIRRQLGETKVLQTDLLPLMKSYWEETELFDVLLRLLVNLTTPALLLWNEEPPTDKTTRNYYLQIEDHLKNYKQAFNDETVWAVLSTRISKILEIDYAERGDENSLIIERILILIRNILYIPPDPYSEKRPDNDASIHDQVLWALQQSGMLDIILFISSSGNEKAYYMHTLEILSFMLREQKASELANAALQRSEMEKITDEAELLAIRHRETNQRQQKVKMYNGARHSRFGGTYVLKSMKSISDNELIYHKPLNKLDSLNFDHDKKKPKTPKNRCPIKSNTFERRSAFTIRLFLKEFCVEFLNGAYNTLMYHVKDNLVRAKAQAHDESYYLWALRFFMEFNRCYKFEVKLVSETMSLQSFHYVQQLTENYFEQIAADKKKFTAWSLRLHLALMAYRELLLTLSTMDRSTDDTVRESGRVIISNVFYVLEYRELVLTLLLNYDELRMSSSYLNDLMETQNIFLKMLESFCGKSGSVVVQKKTRAKGKKKTGEESASTQEPEVDLNQRWDEYAPQLSIILETGIDPTNDFVPFDATSDIPIDEQKTDAMKNIQKKLRDEEFEAAIGLLRASREVWPENDCFGSNNMAPEEEFLALRDIFFTDLGGDENSDQIPQQQPIYNDNDEEEDDEREAGFVESDIKFEDFTRRLCNPKIVKACGRALSNFETNSTNTNHCILKLMHRIAFDCKMYVMLFQLSIFRTFQKVYTYKELPQYKELVKFATYIIRQFMKIAEKNPKIYIETLVWKSKADAYEIEFGCSEYQKSAAMARAWTEQQEDELRRLFMEHQENQLEEDVVDWIVNNLIDNTRTRRGVLKKLKEMCLLTDYKGPNKSRNPTKIPRQWGVEEETQLRELFQQFKDNAADPIGCIIENLTVPRSRKNCVAKLLELGVIQDKKEVRKKRAKKSDQGNKSSDSGSESEDDRRINKTNKNTTTVTKKKVHQQKKSTSKPKKKSFSQASNKQLIIQLKSIIDAEMTDALQWLKECFEDAIEDFETDGNDEGIPLVPIMDYAVDAMENTQFQELITALGIVKPFDEQEIYWRIPGSIPLEVLKKTSGLLEQALTNNLPMAEEEPPAPQYSSSDDEDLFDRLRKPKPTSVDIIEEELTNSGGTTEDNLEATSSTSNKRQSKIHSETNSTTTNIEGDGEETEQQKKSIDPSTDDEDEIHQNIIANKEKSPEEVNKRKRRILSESDSEESEANREIIDKQRNKRKKTLESSSSSESETVDTKKSPEAIKRKRIIRNSSEDEDEEDNTNAENRHQEAYRSNDEVSKKQSSSSSDDEDDEQEKENRSQNSNPETSRNQSRIIDSDDEDVANDIKEKSKPRRAKILESDDED